jgi:hypothetical protein
LGGITSSKMMMENLELELKNGLSKLDTQSILMRSFDFGNTITRGGVKIILGCLLYKISTSIFDHIIQKKYIKIEIKPKTKTKTKT